MIIDEKSDNRRGHLMELGYKFTPNRKEIEHWEVVADQILQTLINKNVLGEEYRIRLSATKEEKLFYCLYGFCNGVILFQQNNSCKNRIYGEWHTKKKYFITDGENIEQISTPLKYLRTDGSMDGVVKYFAQKLTNENLKYKILNNKPENSIAEYNVMQEVMDDERANFLSKADTWDEAEICRLLE